LGRGGKNTKGKGGYSLNKWVMTRTKKINKLVAPISRKAQYLKKKMVAIINFLKVQQKNHVCVSLKN